VKYIDEYRDATMCRSIIREIAKMPINKTVTLMEVCGTHTMAIARYGLRGVLPDNVRLISGPGCPVCVTPNSYIDHACALAKEPNVTITTFGDLVRVPGSTTNLERLQATGADVRVVFSPLEALTIATNEPERHVVFLGVGFETTAPTVAALILAAAQEEATNVSVLASPKLIPPPMRALAGNPEVAVDGYICPAHVSAIIGTSLYEDLAKDFGIPCVVAGFEPVDILRSIHMILERTCAGNPGVDIEYGRIVRPEGNPRALEVLYQVFEPVDTEWRGLGIIPESGMAIRSEYARFDAERRFDVEPEPLVEHRGCRCGEILCGTAQPTDCPLFGRACTPHDPVGACMVSTEGTCAAAYQYAGVRL
jgi:hydrogenase expression/formation protein HypD